MFKQYLAKTKWGSIYVLGIPSTYKQVKYYDTIYSDHSIKSEEIDEMIELTDEMIESIFKLRGKDESV